MDERRQPNPIRGAHRFRCYAKINTCLAVGPKRADGYHPIATIYQSIGLHDILEIQASAEFAFTCSDPSLPTDEGNLVVRAARLFFEAARLEPMVRIHLEKFTPAAAGLGGGSSDAAAALRALNQLHGSPLGAEELSGLALQLGSDAPFFLLGGRARGAGRGELLTPEPDAGPYNLLIVKPEIGVSAAEAYRYFDLTFGPQFTNINLSGCCAGNKADEVGRWRNDLERGVFTQHPEIRRVKQDLLKWGAEDAIMCGSGSAVAGRFVHGEKARACEQRFSAGGQAAILTRPISAAQYSRGFAIRNMPN